MIVDISMQEASNNEIIIIIICPRCKIRLTYEHLILDCPIYSSFRNFTPSTSLIELLSDNEQSVSEVLEFMKDSQIINKI